MLALDEARKAGVQFNVTSGYRSAADQARLYANRATNPNPVAPPGKSKHEQGLAADVALADEGQRAKLTSILASHGWDWRLGQKDRVHYEYNPQATAARGPSVGESPQAYVTQYPLPKERVAGYITDFPLPQAQAKPAAPGLLTDFPLPSAKPARGRLGQALPANYYGGEQVQGVGAIGPKHGTVRPVVAAEPKTGRKIDPTNGQPFVKGRPHEVPQRSLGEQGLEVLTPALQGAGAAYQRGINRTVSGAYPIINVANSVVAENTKVQQKYKGKAPVAAQLGAIVRGAQKSKPWQAFVNGIVKGEATDINIGESLAKDPTTAGIVKQIPGGAATIDFILSFPLYEIAGAQQAAALGEAGGVARSVAQKTGVGEALLNRFPRLRQHIEHVDAYTAAREIMNRNAAGMDKYLRQAEEAVTDLHQTSRKYSRKQIRGSNPFTRQPTNVLDQHIADYIDAGNPGSKWEWIHPADVSPEEVTRARDVSQALLEIQRRAKSAVAGILSRSQAAQDQAAQELAQITATIDRMKAQGRTALPGIVEQGQQAEAAGQAAIGPMGARGRAEVERLASGGQPREVLPPVPASSRVPITPAFAGGRARAALPGIIARGQAKAAAGEAQIAQAQAEIEAMGQRAKAATEALLQHTAQGDAAAKQALDDVLARARKALPGIQERGIASDQAQAQRREAELARVIQSAKASGIDPADVKRIAEKFAKVTDALGEHLVYYGLLDADAFKALRGQYLPRLYQMTGGDPGDVDAFLQLMEEQGAMTPEGIRAARQRLSGRQARQNFTQSRKITDYGARTNLEQGQAVVPEATPAFSGYVPRAAGVAGRAAGHAEIAANPTLALPVDQAPANWVNFTGKGPLEGYAVHPGVDALLRQQNNQGAIYTWLKNNQSLKAAQNWQAINSFTKRLWVSSPKTAVNNIVGNVVLGESAAAVHGINKTLPEWLAGYGKAVKQMFAAQRGGAIPARLQEALDHTSILRESALEVPTAARTVGAGFGVETPAERLKQLPGKAFSKYGELLYATPEKAARYHLYSELRDAGHSIEDAERIVNNAMVTYTDIGPLRRELERNALIGTPFITFPTKAVFSYAQTAALRPDRFYTYTGERLRQFLDSLAQQKFEEKGGQPEAGPKARRAAGLVSPFEVPVPGDIVGGKQQYRRGQVFAPMAASILGNKGGDIFTGVGERLAGANPLLNLARNLFFNKTGPLPDQYPIVPPGSVPGTTGTASDVFRSGRIARAYGAEIAKAILPEYNDFARVIGSLSGEPEYESVTAPVPKLGASLLRAFTGIAQDESIGLTREEKAFRLAKKLEDVPESAESRFATGYAQQVMSNISQQGIQWTPSPRFQSIADQYDPAKLTEAAKNAEASLNLSIARAKGTNTERQRVIREKIDWLVALNLALARKSQQNTQFLLPEQQQMLGIAP